MHATITQSTRATRRERPVLALLPALGAWIFLIGGPLASADARADEHAAEAIAPQAAPTRPSLSKLATKACEPGQRHRQSSKGKRGESHKRGGKPGHKSRGPRHHHAERHVAATKGGQPNVQALGALVIDLETGRELWNRRPDLPRSIASISKLAAALTVMDHNLDLDGLTTIKRVDVDVARGGARSRLLEGMTLSNRDLLHAALLGSDNRAVSALGRAVGLGSAQLTSAMNRKVAALGLRFTRFREPTGLSADNQSTPRETIAMLRAAMAHPVLGPIVKRVEYDAHPVSRPAIHYISTHRPAARPNVQVLGGKTGYNDSARYCLVIAARIDGRSYGIALLGTEGDLTRFGDVARIADWIVLHHDANHALKSSPPSAPQGPPPPEAILAPDQPDGGVRPGQQVGQLDSTGGTSDTSDTSGTK
ncbi:MAG: serine hydrolase [Polyangia bacterium]|jgi:D-alanyl-D-alanine endopeptidase (penicillin-binding protein 7)